MGLATHTPTGCAPAVATSLQDPLSLVHPHPSCRVSVIAHDAAGSSQTRSESVSWCVKRSSASPALNLICLCVDPESMESRMEAAVGVVFPG